MKPKSVLLDQIHIDILVSPDLDDQTTEAMIHQLKSRQFMRKLHNLIREHIASYPTLRRATVRLSR